MSGVAEKLYSCLSPKQQDIAISMYGFFWKYRRFGGVFTQKLEEFESRLTFSKDQWNTYQEIHLRLLLSWAFENVPYYTQRYSSIGLNADDLANFRLSDLSSLPFLEKSDLRRFGRTTLLSKKRSRGRFFQSSGSTGTPVSIFYSHKFHQEWSAAFESRIRYWAGVDRFTPRGMIGGRRVIPYAYSQPPFYRYNAAEAQTYFSAYHLSIDTVSSYVEGMYRHNVQYLTGYASSIYILSTLISRSGLIPPSLRAVITSSEKLTVQMRELIQDVFSCDVFDSYSGVEACALVSEDKNHQLRISPDVGIIEFLGSTESFTSNDMPSQQTEIVCTGLLNFDQPLIRYRIGDHFSQHPFKTSHLYPGMPSIYSIDGRTEDIICGPDGRLMTRFHSLFVGVPFLVTSQLCQIDSSTYIINLVVEPCWQVQYEQVIRNRLFSQLGNVDVTFRYLDNIPLTPSGKFRAVIRSDSHEDC